MKGKRALSWLRKAHRDRLCKHGKLILLWKTRPRRLEQTSLCGHREERAASPSEGGRRRGEGTGSVLPPDAPLGSRSCTPCAPRRCGAEGSEVRALLPGAPAARLGWIRGDRVPRVPRRDAEEDALHVRTQRALLLGQIGPKTLREWRKPVILIECMLRIII